MIRVAVVGVTASLFLLTAGCSQPGPEQGSHGLGGNGGSTAAGGATGSGGTTGAGGSDDTSGSGGSTSSGGTTSGSGGTSGSSSGGASSGAGGSGGAGGSAKGGTTGSGGSVGGGGTTARGGSGGATGSGGAAGSGGGPSSGGSGSGGATAGKGGATGQGGATTGTGGTSGQGGATGTLNPADIVPDLDGFYWEGTCTGNVSVSGKNCPLYDNGATTCASGTSFDTRGTIRDKTLVVKGTSGTQYTINFEVRGVVGTRCYTGGKAASTATPSADGPNNTWYEGGKQANDSIWNTYELHVDPPVTGAPNVYYFNSFPSNPNWCQKEATYQVKYTASFKVLGGGSMKFTVHDANCQAQQNCGSNESSTTCDSPRSNIDLTGMSPAATFKQPPSNTVGTKTYYPQWLYFDVKSVTSP
jgi:hypothetical protein